MKKSVTLHIKPEKILDSTAENQDGKQIEQKPEPEGRRVRLETSLPAVVKLSHLRMSNTVDVKNSRRGPRQRRQTTGILETLKGQNISSMFEEVSKNKNSQLSH